MLRRHRVTRLLLASLGLSTACASSTAGPAAPAAVSASPHGEAPPAPAFVNRCVPLSEREKAPRTAEQEDGDEGYAHYHDQFRAVAERFAARDVGAVETCCALGGDEPHLFEYCSAATALLRYEHDDEAFLGTMPSTRERNGASNEVDMMLSDFETEGEEPFALYFRRAWALAHAGNERAVEGFLVMFEHSHGIFAEAAEGSLCPEFHEQPALFARLRKRHRAAVDELHAHCPPRK